MTMSKTAALPALALAFVLVLSACSSAPSLDGTPQASQADVQVMVTATPVLRHWMDAMADAFNRSAPRTAGGKSLAVTVTYDEAGSMVGKMASAARPDMWIPDNDVWSELSDKRNATTYAADCRSLAASPLVIAMWRPLAESLGWPARNLGWLDISSLTADPEAWAYYSGGQYGKTLRFAHAHPGLAGSGASTLLAVVQSARQRTDALTVEQIDDPIVRASLNAFEGGVSLFALDSEKLFDAMQKRGAGYLGAAIVYESTVLAGTSQDDELVVIHPFEGTVQATHPACISSAADMEKREGATLFRDYLLAPAAQASAVDNGLRPADRAAKLPARFAAGQPRKLFLPPTLPVVEALQSSWKVARKPVNLVMLIDVSGSMRGEKIERVRNSAAQFVRQMGDEDYLTIVTFSDKPLLVMPRERVAVVRNDAIAAVGKLNAQGNTALFDSIAVAADEIATSTSPSRANIIVVLSDGKDTSSNRYHMTPELTTLAVQNDTSLFTIAYGADAAANVMSELANKSNGSYFVGTTANIGDVYQEISAAFGGNVGVGR